MRGQIATENLHLNLQWYVPPAFGEERQQPR
jgi:hypothetical protein